MTTSIRPASEVGSGHRCGADQTENRARAVPGHDKGRMNMAAKSKVMTAKQTAAMTFDAIKLDDLSHLTNEAWMKRARQEAIFVRIATSLCCNDDKTLKARVNRENVEELIDLYERLVDWKKTYNSSGDLMKAASLRLLVALSDWEVRKSKKGARGGQGRAVA